MSLLDCLRPASVSISHTARFVRSPVGISASNRKRREKSRFASKSEYDAEYRKTHKRRIDLLKRRYNIKDAIAKGRQTKKPIKELLSELKRIESELGE